MHKHINKLDIVDSIHVRFIQSVAYIWAFVSMFRACRNYWHGYALEQLANSVSVTVMFFEISRLL